MSSETVLKHVNDSSITYRAEWWITGSKLMLHKLQTQIEMFSRKKKTDYFSNCNYTVYEVIFTFKFGGCLK